MVSPPEDVEKEEASHEDQGAKQERQEKTKMRMPVLRSVLMDLSE